MQLLLSLTKEVEDDSEDNSDDGDVNNNDDGTEVMVRW